MLIFMATITGERGFILEEYGWDFQGTGALKPRYYGSGRIRWAGKEKQNRFFTREALIN
jgi:hypothetical protein